MKVVDTTTVGESAKSSVSPELGAKIIKICHKYRKEGIALDSIKHYFHREFLYEWNLRKEGFESIQQLIDCMIEDKYPIKTQLDGEGSQILSSNLKTYYHWLAAIKVRQKFSLMDILADIPEDVISCSHQLPEFRFPDSVELNGMPEILSGNILSELKYSDVKLMTIRSPHEMYLQICGEDYHYSYHRLRIEMRFYDKRENEEKYRIPCLLLFEGLLCAVKYPKICDEWHRSMIIAIDSQNNCRLLLVDIGEIIETNANEMRLLLKKFSQLPAQALKVQLAAIRPIGKSGQKWSKWANNLVKKLEDNNHCGGMECAFVDYRCDRYRVFIRYYDRFKSSNTNDLLLLHQILVDKKLAVITSYDEPID